MTRSTCPWYKCSMVLTTRPQHLLMVSTTCRSIRLRNRRLCLCNQSRSLPRETLGAAVVLLPAAQTSLEMFEFRPSLPKSTYPRCSLLPMTIYSICPPTLHLSRHKLKVASSNQKSEPGRVEIERASNVLIMKSDLRGAQKRMGWNNFIRMHSSMICKP